MKTLEELQAIREKMKGGLSNRDTETSTKRVVVGMATCGIAAGARPVMQALIKEVAARNLSDVKVAQTGCIGMCKLEPIVEVFVPGQDKVTYVHMDAEKVKRVIAEHIVNGNIVKELTIQE